VHRYWGGLQGIKTPVYPLLLRGAVNASANIGNIIGQLLFGFLGDALGRKFVYGKEMIIAIVGIVLVISMPNSIPTPTLKMWYLFGFRLLMGIGIGGDYPMSASIVAERSTLHNRGRMLAWIFSNQGWVSRPLSRQSLSTTLCFDSGCKSLVEESLLIFHQYVGYSCRLNCDTYPPRHFQSCSRGRSIWAARRHMATPDRSCACASFCNSVATPDNARREEVSTFHGAQLTQRVVDGKFLNGCRERHQQRGGYFSHQRHRFDNRPVRFPQKTGNGRASAGPTRNPMGLVLCLLQ